MLFLSAALNVKHATSQSRSARTNRFFPLAKKSLNELLAKREWLDVYSNAAAWREHVCKSCDGEAVVVTTADGRALSGIFARRANDELLQRRDMERLRSNGVGTTMLPRDSAVLLFHANACVALDMVEYCIWYRAMGMHVLMVSMSAYGDSEGEASESSTYMDADAAFRWIQSRLGGLRPERVVAHGLSIGAALAFALADRYPGMHVCSDQGFTTAKEVAGVVARKALGEYLPDTVVNAFCDATFPAGIATPDGRFITDGYDNVTKAKRLHGSLFVMSADGDAMMPSSFADALLDARYSKPPPVERNGARCDDGKKKPDAVGSSILHSIFISLGSPEPSTSGVQTHSTSGTTSLTTGAEVALKAIAEEEQEKTKCAIVLAGQHGTFFGEQPEQAAVYHAHLVKLGLVADRQTIISALKETHMKGLSGGHSIIS